MKTRKSATRRTTYAKITAGNMLSPARMAVYADLHKHGPSTVGQITKRLTTKRTGNPSFHRRLAELEELGVVARKRGKLCPISGFKADVWRVTGTLPTALSVPRYPKGLAKETLYLGLEEIFFLVHRFRRLNPKYSAPAHLSALCAWLGRRGMAMSRRDKVASTTR